MLVAAAEGVFGVTKVPSSHAERAHIHRTFGIPEDYVVPMLPCARVPPGRGR